jgi:putative transposase
MKTKNRYEPQFKTQVVLSVISEKMSMAEACRKYNLNQQVVVRWKSEFLEKAQNIFAAKGQQSREHEQKIEELERMVGKLTMQLEILKKASILLG